MKFGCIVAGYWGLDFVEGLELGLGVDGVRVDYFGVVF